MDVPEDAVTALHYDDLTAAAELAAWCGGTVVTGHDPVDLTREPTAVRVPTADGAALAWLGDWIVLMPNGCFHVESHEQFVATHEPLT